MEDLKALKALQAILDNAPKTTTSYKPYINRYGLYNIRSLSDIQTIVDLKAENAELKEVLSLWIDGYELQNTHKLQRFEVWSESVNLLARSEGE